MAQDPRRQRAGVRRGRHPRRHCARPADDRERSAGAVRERHHADRQQSDLGRRQQEGPAAQAAWPRRAQRRDFAQRRLRRGCDREAAGLGRSGVSTESMPTYRLHYFPESGNSYKLALMLTLCGERFEPVWTDFGGGVTRTAEWRRTVNAMGEIPVLEVDGESRTQTAPILLGLAEQYGRFGGETAAEKFEVLRWLFWDNHKLTGYMATYRFHRTFTPTPD